MTVTSNLFFPRRPVEVAWPLVTSALWLVTMSATLVESYAYRYAAGILALIALYLHLNAKPRPAMDWRGWLCVGWAIYALGRFLGEFLMMAGHPTGDRELLFSLPLAFPLLGFMLFLCWDQIERIIAAYFVVALLFLAVTTQYGPVFAGETVRPLIQHNQIHGAVCCGIITISAIMWMLHYRTAPLADRSLRMLSTVITPPIVVLCLIAIYGAKSKGVWLALGLSLPILVAVIIHYLRPRAGLAVAAVFLGILAASVYLVRDNLYHTAGPTVMSTISMLEGVSSQKSIGGAISETIDDGVTPISMDERLQLWSDACELISAAPWLGWGNAWPEQWHRAHYPPKYTLMHNGYLEVLIRHGLFGAAVFSIMFIAFGISVYRAADADIIPRAAMHAYFLILIYFAFTLLSNSNNRLAIGESLALMSAAFALACNVKLRLRAGDRFEVSQWGAKAATTLADRSTADEPGALMHH